MKKFFKDLPPVLFFSIIPIVLVWIPFIFRLDSFWNIPLTKNGLATIVANYDGPLYLIIAKTLYNTESIKTMFSVPLPVEYYAAHFPLFPILIRLFSFIGNYPYAMLTATVLSSVYAMYFFKKLISQFVREENIVWMMLIFAILPARWLIVRSVGSPEPLFVGSIIASLFYFKNKKYLLAGIFGAIAQITKSPGILLFAGYIGFFIFEAIYNASISHKTVNFNFVRKLPLFLIPLSLLGVFFLYSKVYGNFYAYFDSGDNIHLFFPPFQIFNYSQPWVNTFWLEEVVLVYIIALLGIFKLFEKKEFEYAIFTAVFFTTIIFVSHRDIIRYALPIVPFILAGFSETLTKKSFRLLLLIVALPIYLFSLAYISQNVMPISNWAPFL
ncbi:MAG: hypothetical protein US62_C0005G0033 [Candidatus Woesebacteria bacterium GW2011_GWA1_37_8]|uniref:Glycosyltransferase RgtA/B/C/D-like domain-containing protein n=2 Tax=Candidatus Woeseibacteriota TaxID=1752722 RepID=A0A0G0NLF1_9BACT|nr:MAG: hypothetical protein US39_C0005G0052 [Microgenomates group bacterium GW2011_GWC1_37_12b]KKQ46110.1 MAG: hypothetical protein US62_C0005G0033 [Candidatus Woesebacteria bacterium GW2011_GWA1_37_8]KKQ86719.1 MAG: hypothetical protein UT10_C0018G0031 [Candidatus Woesebacteria bacterium GW2011_GWB1_38_8b]